MSSAGEQKALSDNFCKQLAQLGDNIEANILKDKRVTGPLIFFAKENQVYHCCLATKFQFSDSEKLQLAKDNRHTLFSLDSTLTDVCRMSNKTLRRLCGGNLSKVYVLTQENEMQRLSKYLGVKKKALRKRPGRYLQQVSGPSSLPELRKKLSSILGIRSSPKKRQPSANPAMSALRKQEMAYLNEQASDFANQIFIEEELAKFPSRN